MGICAWKIGEAFFRPRLMLEWPFLASAMWLYFYGYMAYNAKVGLPEYLGNGIANIGQLMPLLCLIGLIAGWHFGTQPQKRIVPDRRRYPYAKIYLAGAVFVGLGAAGGYSVLRAVQSGTMNYQASSGYWYLLFYVGYPGLAMTIWALFRMEPSSRKYLWFVTLLALAAFMFPHVLNARRGPLFPAVMGAAAGAAPGNAASAEPITFHGGPCHGRGS